MLFWQRRSRGKNNFLINACLTKYPRKQGTPLTHIDQRIFLPSILSALIFFISSSFVRLFWEHVLPEDKNNWHEWLESAMDSRLVVSQIALFTSSTLPAILMLFPPRWSESRVLFCFNALANAGTHLLLNKLKLRSRCSRVEFRCKALPSTTAARMEFYCMRDWVRSRYDF